MFKIGQITFLYLCSALLVQCSGDAGFNGASKTAKNDSKSVEPKSSEGTPENTPANENLEAKQANTAPETYSNFDFKPGAEDIPENCSNNHRALRLAIVVDNSGSMGCQEMGLGGKVFDIDKGEKPCGTDPRKKSAKKYQEIYTDRQDSIFNLVQKTLKRDLDAVAKNPEFIGSAFALTSFRGDNGAGGKTTFHSGTSQSALPDLMTESKDIKKDKQFDDGLWDLLKFTHSPGGMTPYKIGLEGAKEVFDRSNQNADPRQKVLLFVTDGLPTDMRPSQIKEASKALGDDVYTILLFLYTPDKNKEEYHAPTKASLKQRWDRDQWGRAPGNNDGFKDFEEYWTTLVATPNEISDKSFDVSQSADLAKTVDGLLDVIQKCPIN